ncbi:hypothetical protein [Streptomyces sp. NPDC095602]|uniref:hypothetical protein n=1 Tax=Streptomyces sp. NPDC095602 TaxID=3155819 RepID=UPI00332B1F26
MVVVLPSARTSYTRMVIMCRSAYFVRGAVPASAVRPCASTPMMARHPDQEIGHCAATHGQVMATPKAYAMAPQRTFSGRNDALRAARLGRGWRTIEQAADELSAHGRRLLDDRHFNISARTWRRWEGARPGWPPEATAVVLHDALGRWPEDLGFTPPPGWIRPEHHEDDRAHQVAFAGVTAAALVPGPTPRQHVDPALIGYFQQQLEGHYRADMFLGRVRKVGGSLLRSWCVGMN